MKRLVWLAAVATFPSLAWAGGFTRMDNGTEALGRGDAFTAKADNATALDFNVAGLARQRGTHVLLDANLSLYTYDFTRAGTYPDDPNFNYGGIAADAPTTPYGGQPYPKIGNNGGLFLAPFLGITTDFGRFDRWTFALGVYGPSSYGNKQYPISLSDGRPSPQRYDVVSANLLIIFPTLAAAYRISKWLDVGLALHLVVAKFQVANVSLVDLGRGKCPTAEYVGCDSTTNLDTSGVSATFSAGAMVHPFPWLAIGLNLRGPVYIDTAGTVTASSPAVQKMTIDPGSASFHSRMPWVARLGVRYIFLKDGFERGDIEVDGVYEAWNEAEHDGDHVNIPNLSFFTDINPTITHHYLDTVSIRVGGAYNVRLPVGVLSVRAGFYYDSSATLYKDTHMDFDTMAKYAPTLGLGYKVRGVQINVAYAYIWSPDRDVNNGEIRSINGTNGTHDGATGPLPVINNGLYHASSQILSVGINIAWDEALKKSRVVAYE